jgi:hypothetical protein
MTNTNKFQYSERSLHCYTFIVAMIVQMNLFVVYLTTLSVAQII